MGKTFSLFEKKDIVKTNNIIKSKKINDEELKLIRDKINKMNENYKEKKPFNL